MVRCWRDALWWRRGVVDKQNLLVAGHLQIDHGLSDVEALAGSGERRLGRWQKAAWRDAERKQIVEAALNAVGHPPAHLPVPLFDVPVHLLARRSRAVGALAAHRGP